MKNNYCKHNYCQKENYKKTPCTYDYHCFCEPLCNCTPSDCKCSKNINDSLESIVSAEASISCCAAKLFANEFACDISKIDDPQKKINLFSTLLLSYSNRACSLGKLLASVSDFSFIPCLPPECNMPCDCPPPFTNHPSNRECTPECSCTDKFPDLNPPPCCNTTCGNTTYAKYICNGIYYLEKIKIYYSKYCCSKIYEVYYDVNCKKFLYTFAKTSSCISRTFIL